MSSYINKTFTLDIHLAKNWIKMYVLLINWDLTAVTVDLHFTGKLQYYLCWRGVAADRSDARSIRRGGRALKPLCPAPSCTDVALSAREVVHFVIGRGVSSPLSRSQWQRSGLSGNCANTPSIKSVSYTRPPWGESNKLIWDLILFWEHLIPLLRQVTRSFF